MPRLFYSGGVMSGVSAEKMSEIDRRAQEDYGIPEDVLMENAGSAVCEAIVSEHPYIPKEKIVVFCGKGNNGGDGFVIARLLQAKEPSEILVVIPEVGAVKTGASEQNFKLLQGAHIKILTYNDFFKVQFEKAFFSIIIDAIFGTGFKGQITGSYAEIVRWINSSDGTVYSVDIPSGLNATTGEAFSPYVQANKTISFGLPKTGFFLNKGPACCGDITVSNIGFPKELLDQYQSK